MKICIVAEESGPRGDSRGDAWALARLLAARHEVRLVEADQDPELGDLTFSCPAHRRSAEVMSAVRAAYPRKGPHYVEVGDGAAAGLILLQARLSGDPLLRDTVVGVRVGPASGLIAARDCSLGEPEVRVVSELEREQLRLADVLIWPGGECFDQYQDHYGPDALPRPFRIRPAVDRPTSFHSAPAADPERPLQMLYAGPLSRSGGALDLAEACLALPFDEWELTMAGADSDTAVMGQSVRLTIEALTGADPRLRLEGQLSVDELRSRLPHQDLLVAPSPLGTGAMAVIEAMRSGVPVLASPAGELVELVEDGVTGWLAAASGPAALRKAIAAAAERREELASMRAAGTIGERFSALADPERILDGYERMLAEVRPLPAAAIAVPPAPAERPLVTGVVPYFDASPFVAEAVDSLLRQTHRELEVVIVNDGSFHPEDAVLEQLATDPRVTLVTQPNTGEASARALGVTLARGEYVVMLDADNVVEPEFVERALSAFRRDPELAYVTCWLTYVGPDGQPLPEGAGYAALGNGVRHSDDQNWDGDTLAVLPRRVLVGGTPIVDRESAICTDWELYRMLRAEGRYGTVIPERMGRYRVLADSLSRRHDAVLQRIAWSESRVRIEQRRSRLSREH